MNTRGATRSGRASLLPVFHRSHSGEQRMMRGLREWKYLALLVAFMVAAVLEPLSVTWTERAQSIGAAAVLVLNVPVYLVVFEGAVGAWFGVWPVTALSRRQYRA